MRNWFKKKLKNGADKKDRTLEETQQEFVNLCAQLGQQIYTIEMMKDGNKTMIKQMQALNHETHALRQKQLAEGEKKRLEVVKQEPTETSPA